MAFRLAEDPAVMTPVMVNLDGFALTHTYETVDIPAQEQADRFLPPYTTSNKFDFEHPLNMGFTAGPAYNKYFKYREHQDLLAVPAVIDQVEREFAEVFGRQYPGVIETYRCADAELILITLGSIAGLARDVVDRLRAQGQRVGLLRIRYLRPMPADQIAEAVAGARAVAVLEKDVSFGAEGSVFTNVNSALQQAGITVPTCNFIGGLGGDDIKADDLATVFEELGRITEGEDVPAVSWIGIDGAWAETSPYAQEGDGAR